MRQQQYKISLSNFIFGLLLLRKPPVRRAAFRIAQKFWNDYHKVQLEKFECVYNVESQLDKKIPYWGNAWKPYMGYPIYLISFLGYLHRVVGNRILPDIEKFLFGMSELYSDAKFVFHNTPTTLTRSGGKWFAKFYRKFIDGDNNAAPSIHVAQAAFIYFKGMELVKKYQLEHAEEIELHLFRKACQVIDSTLLVKQHCILDVAFGLALVAFRFPAFSSDAERFTHAMFMYSPAGIESSASKECGLEIKKLYNQIIEVPNLELENMCGYIAALPKK